MAKKTEKLTALIDWEQIWEKGRPREWEEWLMARRKRIRVAYCGLAGCFTLTFKHPDDAFEFKMRWL